MGESDTESISIERLHERLEERKSSGRRCGVGRALTCGEVGTLLTEALTIEEKG
jgi:hypothetical protein